MLYVFIVSTGTTMKFDMNLAVKKVSELKTEVYRCVHIPVDDQVLLCSGGEELMSENIVGNYFGAGTDTNPIFLFSKSDFKLPFNDNASSIDLSIINDVKACANMDPSIQTITIRAELAQDLAELALKGKKECNELVHQQHLQQQGWAAVIANLEDAKDSLLKRKHHFDELFEKYLSNRASYQEIIKIFPEDIVLLAKIPLLSKLLIESGCSEEDLQTEHTLLSWFCSEPQHVLETLAEKCQQTLDELNEKSLIDLNEKMNQVLRSADNPDIKEVRGIEERLSSLNKQIEGAEKLSKDQSDLTGIFSPDRINYARDPNVLPDVCRTYQNQLELMLQNHMCLGEILKKCKNAKLELSESIKARIKYICPLESEMYDLQVRIIFLEKHVKSVVNQIESFRQVHLAPQRYLKMLAEVCRRKEFSTNFMKWAKDLSEKASSLYHKELALRKEFSSEEFKNMVDNLFPGMDDTPPSFAVKCPPTFDEHLPNITKEDLDFLKILFPELSHLCDVVPSEPMPYLSQAGTDSAFSSNLPSSLKITSLEASHSNILKVHAKISELQKFIRMLQGTLQSDLTSLKEFVKDELSERMSDVSQVVEKITLCVEKLHEQMVFEKEHAISEARKEFASIEIAYIHRLEVESQKLNDAENQIASYQERLQEVSTCYDEMKLEKEQLFQELDDTKETLKQMVLEHELEFDSFKNQIKDSLEDKDSLVVKLKQTLYQAENEVQSLKQEKEELQQNFISSKKEMESSISEMIEERSRLCGEIVCLKNSKSSSQNFLEQELVSKIEHLEKELFTSKQQFEDFQTEMERDKQRALTEQEERLSSKHKDDLVSLRSRFKLAVSTTSIDRVASSSPEPNDTGSPSSLEDLRKVITADQEKMEIDKQVKTKQEEIIEKLNNELLQIEAEKEKVIAFLKLEHEEALERLKSRITAESQVSFNEAINRLAKEKDATIEDLRSNLSILQIKHAAILAHIDKYKSESRLDHMSHSETCPPCANDLQKREEDIFLMKLKELANLEQINIRDQSVDQVTPSSLVSQESVKKKHKTREDYQRPSRGYLWKYPCMDCKNKISILTCNDGDLVLLCYEEKHQNFAVFHIGEFAHFLHSDSLQALNLKLPEDSAERTRTVSPKWALGVVLHKEFCVTKKKENRYKVTLGTKFYRVKVKAWDRETAFTLHQMQQSTLMTATICAPKSPNLQITTDDGKAGKSSDMSASSI